jgi:RHS repeat-associated protein
MRLDSLLSHSFMVSLNPFLLPAVSVNVALASNGGIASASSTFSASFPVSAAINGDRKGLGWGNGGGWADANNGVFPDWLQVNFSGPTAINEIDLFTVQDDRYNPVEPTETMTFTQFGITTFQVQYWNGASWLDVPGGNVTGNNKVWRKFTFPDITTGSIRFVVNGSPDGWSRITEVEAYQSVGPAPNYGGWLDTGNCTLIGGWAWDSNQPNTPINVDVYDGALKILSNVPANQYRSDLQAAGIGNGYHAFAIATPSSLKDGGSHSISVKFAGTSSNLSGTPGSITCSTLVGYWKFDEGSGLTAADSSGNNLTGTLTGGPTWTTGRVNGALSFNGAGSYVQVGAPPSLVMSTAMTISAWINPTGDGIIVNKEDEYEVAVLSGHLQWAIANSNPGWAWIDTGYIPPLNQWAHIAVTYDSGLVKTYANGVLVHTYAGAGTIGDVDPALNDFRIGGRQCCVQYFSGSIDEVRIYNRALSATEIQSLVQSLVQSPFNGPHNVPGITQAEDFDNGGEGVAYHDNDAGNAWGFYRTNVDVDITPDSVAAGGAAVGNARTGEWLEYTVNVTATGSYDIVARVASDGAGGAFHYVIDPDGSSPIITPQSTAPNTLGWSNYQNAPAARVSLTQGTHIIRVALDQNGTQAFPAIANFDYFNIVTAGSARTGSITAGPNPIQVCDGSGLGVTTLSWTSTGTSLVEVHVGSPTGALFAQTGPSGTNTTGKWVANGTVFYLQDVSGGLPLTAANTLATVTVGVTTSGCPTPPLYEGWLDGADCSTIFGWAADRNRLNTSINVDVYDGATLLATVPANQLRSDVGAYLGDNGLHGYSYAVPTSLKNGQPHSITVKFSGTGTNLAGTPRSITCSTCSVPVAPPPASLPPDNVWVEDQTPTGAVLAGTWVWDTSQKASGSQSNTEPAAAGIHQHFFYGAPQPLSINPGDKLVSYVLLNPCNPPQEIMLQWNDSAGSWEHRAFWGADLIPWGAPGTTSRFPMGALPQTGVWVRLEVPASAVGLEGNTINGLAFTLYDGQAWFDRAGKLSQLRPISATASNSYQGAPPSQAMDGSLGTMWNSGGFAPQWIQLDLGQPSTISQIRLNVAQLPNGQTTHEIYGGTDPQALTLMRTISGATQDGQWLEPTFSPAVSNIRYLQIRTTASPSWVAWNEIEVYGSITVNPPPPPPPTGTGTGLRGDYFNNMTLAGVPALTRTDPTVDFSWGTGSPAAGINIDQFSARWTGQLQAQFSETYTFFVFSDDGVRLWVNGQLLLDRWVDQFGEFTSAPIALVAGQKYDIKVEYYENGAGAAISLKWTSPSTAKQVVPQSQLYPATAASSPNSATFISHSVPTSMVAGQSYSVSVTMQNTGTNTWTSASLYRLGSQNPQDNGIWGTGRVALPASVAPGSQITFSFTVTAPATAGAYNFQWRMVQDGVMWFGDSSPNVVVTVSNASPPPLQPPTDSLTVNQIGRLTSVGNGSMRIFNSYDALGRTTQTVHKLDGTNYVTLTRYGYPQKPATPPELGTVVAFQSLPDFERLDYTYDAGGAQQSIKTTPRNGSQQTIVSSVRRNSRGQTTQVVYGNGAVSTHSYNDATNLRLNQIKTIVGATTLQDYGYSFDNNGNVTGVTDNVTSTLSAAYGYDSLDQLTSMTPAGQLRLPYAYDNLGNLRNKENVTQTYGGVGRGPHALATSNGVTYNYDANGNLIETRDSSNRVVTAITWNAENMPINVVQSGVTIYQKFFLGESLWKKVEPGVTTYYLPSMRLENGLFRKFFGGFAERSPDGTLKFYHNDHLGSASLVTDFVNNVAHVVSSQAYMPYGEDRPGSVSGNFTSKYQFNFKEKEPTGFYDYGARLYNPATGRWLSADNLSGAGPNRYAYVSNNPLGYTDPTGHFQDPIETINRAAENHQTVGIMYGGVENPKVPDDLTLAKIAMAMRVDGVIFITNNLKFTSIEAQKGLPNNASAETGTRLMNYATKKGVEYRTGCFSNGCPSEAKATLNSTGQPTFALILEPNTGNAQDLLGIVNNIEGHRAFVAMGILDPMLVYKGSKSYWGWKSVFREGYPGVSVITGPAGHNMVNSLDRFIDDTFTFRRLPSGIQIRVDNLIIPNRTDPRLMQPIGPRVLQ